MIRVIPVSKWGKSNDDLQQIYNDSFPIDERREWKEIKKLIDHPNFILNQVFDEQKSIGLITLWHLPGFTFIEHFAIKNSFQGHGIGSQVLMQIIEAKSTKMILEVDEPTTELTKRRITFYERLGFSVCENIYYQPPYSLGQNEVKMLLMCYPEKITPLEFDAIKTQLYREVYGRV